MHFWHCLEMVLPDFGIIFLFGFIFVSWFQFLIASFYIGSLLFTAEITSAGTNCLLPKSNNVNLKS